MTKSILIIDSGMKNMGGHNFSYTRAVQSALEQKGFDVTVLANRSLSGDLVKATGYRPVFSFGAYDFPPGNGKLRDFGYLYAQSVIFSDELEQAFRRVVSDEPSLVFCHTVNDFELIGWNRFLSRRRLPGHLMILMRKTPGFKSCGWLKRRIHPYWRIKPHYLNALHSRQKGRFVLVTDSEPLTEDYSTIFRHRVVTLPIPVSEHILADEQSPSGNGAQAVNREGRIRIGYLGDARASKGFPLLPGLARRILSDTRLEADFIIQCPNAPSEANAGEQPAGVRELIEVASRTNGRITLVHEALSETDYAKLIRSLDVVLVPYAFGYEESTSGIFAEALALSKPVVVPSVTWMSRELRKSGGGVEFQRGDENDLASKVAELIRNFDEYAIRARRFSPEWKAFHNSHSLAEAIIRNTHGIIETNE